VNQYEDFGRPMRKYFFIFFTIAASIHTASPLFAANITWYQPDFPPYVILSGPDKELGIDDQIVHLMINSLPEYTHVFQKANYTRILESLKHGEPGIVTPLFKTKAREKYIHYSKVPSYLVLPNGFIYHKDSEAKYAPFILEDGTLDLQALCKSGKVKIGTNSGRSYFGIIDRTIEKFKGKDVFFNRSGIEHSGLIKMVANKRLDAAFGFPVEIKYLGFNDNLSFLPVSKMVTFIPVYFGASKNKFGIDLIERLDCLMNDKKVIDKFAQYYMAWLDKELIDNYKHLKQDYYKAICP
jgi:uncharacterized protein (TIGR02285 family)